MSDPGAEEAAPTSTQQLCGVCSGVLDGDPSAVCPHSVCGSCLGDKTKGCPRCVQSPGQPEPAEGPKQNGTETPAKSKEEQSPDMTAEETKIQEDLKESEDPKKPEDEPEDSRTDRPEETGAKEKEEVEVKEEPLGPDDVVCDSCIESPCRALKSCLTCLVSYCEAHLRPHLENPKFNNHRLVDPLRDIERRTCESHKWPLEFFCCADACCVCQDCVAEDHRGHNTVPVVEARHQIEVRRSELLNILNSPSGSRLINTLQQTPHNFVVSAGEVKPVSFVRRITEQRIRKTKLSVFHMKNMEKSENFILELRNNSSTTLSNCFLHVKSCSSLTVNTDSV